METNDAPGRTPVDSEQWSVKARCGGHCSYIYCAPGKGNYLQNWCGELGGIQGLRSETWVTRPLILVRILPAFDIGDENAYRRSTCCPFQMTKKPLGNERLCDLKRRCAGNMALHGGVIPARDFVRPLKPLDDALQILVISPLRRLI